MSKTNVVSYRWLNWLRYLLMLVGSLLVLDTLVLLGLSKFTLGIMLPLFVGGIFLIQGLGWQKIHHYLTAHPWQKRLWQIGWLLFILWLLSLVAFFYYLAQRQNTENLSQPVAAIIVLGSGFKDGKPTATLASRLDSAAMLAKTQQQALIVLTGGIGLTETVSEAQVMSNYLVNQHGLPRTRMALEDKSTSTELNLANSQPILQTHGISLSAPIAVVTSDFHTMRAGLIAKKQGYQQVITVGSPTPLLTRYNNWAREYFALAGGWALGEF